jgi:hypothetical protein
MKKYEIEIDWDKVEGNGVIVIPCALQKIDAEEIFRDAIKYIPRPVEVSDGPVLFNRNGRAMPAIKRSESVFYGADVFTIDDDDCVKPFDYKSIGLPWESV